MLWIKPEPPSRLRPWLIPTVCAFVGSLFVPLLLVVGVRSPPWVVVLAAGLTLALVALYAGVRARPQAEALGRTLACIVVEWPILALASLIVVGLAAGAGD